jgi:hypothetical protein
MTAMQLGTAIATLIGLWWSYRLARRTSSAAISTAAVVTVAAGSDVVWLLIREGALLPVMLLPAAAGLALARLRHRDRRDWRSAMLSGFATGLMAVLLLAPLFPLNPGQSWLAPHVVDALWSSRDGLFARSPGMYLATLGLIPLWRIDRPLAAMAMVALVVLTWISGVAGPVWAALIPFVVPGLAAGIAAANRLVARRPGATAAAVLALFVVWNVSLVAVARAGRLRIGEIVSFGDIGAAQAETIHGWIGHPWSMPANLIYAWRNGVSPARFDLLHPNRFLADPAEPSGQIDVGAADAVYLDEGWHQPERDGELTFRWVEDRATLFVPLDHAAPLLVQVRVRAFDYGGATPQQLTLEMNGHLVSGPVISGAWQDVDVPTDAALWRSGLNHVALQFTRATRPVDVGAGGDARRLAAAIDYVRFSIRQ